MSSKVGDCTAIPGYYGLPGVAAKQCPANFYCPGGSLGAIPCPSDSPISSTGGTSLAACQSKGWTLRIYSIPVNTAYLPVLPGLGLLGQSNLPQVITMDSPADFRKWVPSCPDNWFAWQFFGHIAISTAGNYTFGIDSDDGSLLYLDLIPSPNMNEAALGSAQSSATPSPDSASQLYTLVIDNDGLHGARTYTRTLLLQPGLYSTKVKM